MAKHIVLVAVFCCLAVIANASMAPAPKKVSTAGPVLLRQ
jgi:hypothetical protein